MMIRPRDSSERIAVKKEGIVIEKTRSGFENEGVLNPAAMQEGDTVHLLYRAVSKGNYSTVGYCKLLGPLTVAERHDAPLIFPQASYESHGVEDPRITCIDGLYYLSYCAYDGVNALGALATSKDLKQFEKQGIIVPQFSYEAFKHLAAAQGAISEKYARFNDRNRLYSRPDKNAPTWDKDKPVMIWDKNLIFFPRRIHGKLTFLHRIKPDIQLAAVHDLSELTQAFWEGYLLNLEKHIVMTPKHHHEISYIGGGCPPIETPAGWLLIYHGVHDTAAGYVYAACAALLDLEDPQREIARLPYALFSPELEWELSGEVNNVCFPTGTALFGDTLYVYYGAADERIACASMSLSALVDELLRY